MKTLMWLMKWFTASASVITIHLGKIVRCVCHCSTIDLGCRLSITMPMNADVAIVMATRWVATSMRSCIVWVTGQLEACVITVCITLWVLIAKFARDIFIGTRMFLSKVRRRANVTFKFRFVKFSFLF